MQNSGDPVAGIQETLRAARSSGRYLALVDSLIREVRRLDEDNRQLRAAVAVYQEVTRRLEPARLE